MRRPLSNYQLKKYLKKHPIEFNLTKSVIDLFIPNDISSKEEAKK